MSAHTQSAEDPEEKKEELGAEFGAQFEAAAAALVKLKVSGEEKDGAEDASSAAPKRAPVSAALLAGVSAFDARALKPTETVVRHIAYIAGSAPAGAGPDSAIREEEIKEYYDSSEVLLEKAKCFAAYLRESSHTVFHTGAGISTAAKLPDYRGPSGVWTLRAKGYEPSFGITLEQAVPTFSHMAIVSLVKSGLLKHLVSTNVDGLHRRSGVAAECLSELHGNIYREMCDVCAADYLRPFDVTKLKKGRRTGRLCEARLCKGKLRDCIVNFGESLPQDELDKATCHSAKATMNVVMGSSMRVSPACNLPALSYDSSRGPKGRLCIVNLQKTPYDEFCEESVLGRPKGLRVFAKIDDFMRLVMEQLAIDVPEFDETKYKAEVSAMAESIVKDPDFWKVPV